MSAPAAPVVPALSVCIPTYNRAALLEGGLAALGAELDGLAPASAARVEVVICDNASTDATAEVATAFASRRPNVAYRRRPHNIGGDNIYLCTETAAGEFVWIVSDDDLVLPGTLDRLLGAIDADPRLDAIAVNCRSFRHRPDERGELAFPRWRGIEPRTRTQLFTELSSMLTFLSVLVYRRSLVEGVDYGFASGTEIVQAFAFADVVNRGSRFVTLAEPALAYRLANQGHYDYARVFIDNYLDVLDHAGRAGMSAATLRRIRRHHVRSHVLVTMARFKRDGASGALEPDWKGTRRRLRRRCPDDLVGRAAVAAVTLMPAPVFARLDHLARAVRRRGADGRVG